MSAPLGTSGSSAAADVTPDDTSKETAGRAVRADARRNRERLVAAAKEVFAREGGGASMEAVAKQAGVGVGTLYRHFPQRMDLVEAVYQNDVDVLSDAAARAAAEEGPWEGLVAWMEAFLRYAQGKRTFLNELHEAFEKNPELRAVCRERIDQAADLVLTRAQRAGVARDDVDGRDLTQLLAGICTNAAVTSEQAERLLAMVLDGLRPPAERTTASPAPR